MNGVNDLGLLNYIRTGRPIETLRSPEASQATAAATQGVYLLFSQCYFSQV